MEKINIKLPGFPGFYHSDFDCEYAINQFLEWLFEEVDEEKYSQFIDVSPFDYEEYYLRVSKEAISLFEGILKEHEIFNQLTVEFDEVSHNGSLWVSIIYDKDKVPRNWHMFTIEFAQALINLVKEDGEQTEGWYDGVHSMYSFWMLENYTINILPEYEHLLPN